MLTIKPFKAVRPHPTYAAEVAALPYDVMNTEEARVMAAGNPRSFLHIDRAEIDLPPGTDPHAPEVYAKARAGYLARRADGTFTQDGTPCFYLYRLTMDGRAQTGIVACASTRDYDEGRIKKHERTRADKEADRIRHVDTLDANTGPIFLAHRPQEGLSTLVREWAGKHAPLYSFEGPGGVLNEAWRVDDLNAIRAIEEAFRGMDALYIADGHHRCASAARVASMRAEADPAHSGDEEYNFFLSVVFPADELRILDYNRVVKDLNGLSPEQFLAALEPGFRIEPADAPVRPESPRSFGMYLRGKGWHRLAWQGTPAADDPVAALDVSILQETVLAPLLGIDDPRTDARIDFVGGIRGLSELERRAEDDMTVAFSLYPTQPEQLLAIADAGLLMPPKSTWFEPKLLSGLFIHELESSIILNLLN
ncbi:MAG: DUF1015 family protein [Clostridiales Family XIII bacterium]|jgi:uncharacterized protein (DUF1015 family)|nr:DUF1015 family protein [Clostridiales Family XIII bacterium]